MPELPEAIQNALEKHRDNDEISDFTLVSDTGKEWKVHKMVLSFHSDVLYRMSISKDFTEGQSGRVVLHEVCDDAIEALRDHLYFYDRDWADYKLEGVAFTDFFCDLWRLADMYNIERLAKTSVDWFGSLFVLEPDLETFEDLRAWVAEACDRDIPRPLQQRMVEDLATLFTTKHSYSPEHVREILDLHPNLAMDVMTEVAQRKSDLRKA
ncbi:hypothetical protein PRZ48_009293 [Zasmidium cellare]|uniref:BTB domain-containing protein n=1 Tax=Zasmidium cellare TaxID=395010 RepID=A0ABR0EC47_ZASCE|nr:hypothetical protein PRZ48_009293 [Zasmidium cellare]